MHMQTKKVVSTINGVSINEDELATLSNNNWLTDKVKIHSYTSIVVVWLYKLYIIFMQVIDFYMYLIMDVVNTQKADAVYCVTCYFYLKLCASGCKEAQKWLQVQL